MKNNNLVFSGLLAATCGLSALLAPMAAEAATVVINANPGTVLTTDGLTGFQTTGSDMDGMSVTAFFQGGGSETVSWAATGPGQGGVTGAGWSLTQIGDTFDLTGFWTLTSSSAILTGFQLNGVPGRTIFDRTNPSTGTPGSSFGRDFTFISTSDALLDAGTIDVTYSNILAVGANPPVGDLYTLLTVDFSTPLSEGELVFLQDTDNATTNIVVQATPEPGTVMGLVALGLFAATSKRKRS